MSDLAAIRAARACLQHFIKSGNTFLNADTRYPDSVFVFTVGCGRYGFSRQFFTIRELNDFMFNR